MLINDEFEGWSICRGMKVQKLIRNEVSRLRVNACPFVNNIPDSQRYYAVSKVDLSQVAS